MSDHNGQNCFNFALYPQAPELADYFIELAQKNLSGQTEKYLLGDGALPHVTLGHFSTALSQTKLWQALENQCSGVISIQFSHVYIRAGAGLLHAGKNWVGLSVVPAPDLLNLQALVFSNLQKLGIDSATQPESYMPHLTFGRLPAAQAITIAHMPDQSFWQSRHLFCFSLGRANKLGVYAERLF